MSGRARRRALAALLGAWLAALPALVVSAGPAPSSRPEDPGFTPLALPKLPPPGSSPPAAPTAFPSRLSVDPAPTPVVEAPPRLGRWRVDASAVWDGTGVAAPWGSLHLREERGSHAYWVAATASTGAPIVSAGANTGFLVGTLGRLTPDHLPVSLAQRDLSGVDLRLAGSGWRFLDGAGPEPGSRLTTLSVPIAVSPRLSLSPGVTLVAPPAGPRLGIPTVEASARVGDGNTLRGELDLIPGSGSGSLNYSLGFARRRPGLVLNAGFVRLTSPPDANGFLRLPGDSWFAAVTHSLADSHTWLGARAGGSAVQETFERRLDLSVGRVIPSLTAVAGLSLVAGPVGTPVLESSLSLTWPLPLPLTLKASLIPQGPAAGLRASITVTKADLLGLGPGTVRLGYGDGPVGDGWWLELRPEELRLTEDDRSGDVRSELTVTAAPDSASGPFASAGAPGEGEGTWRGRLSAGYFREVPLLSTLGELTGRAYLDANLNGRLDAGEATLPGLRVTLSGGKTAETGPDGRYRFIRVPYGPWQVGLEPATVPARYLLPASGTRIALDRPVAEVDLPLTPAVVVRGRVVVSGAGDGAAAWALPERELADLPVAIAGTTVLTAADGSFALSVAPGDYTAEISPEALKPRRLASATPPVRFRAARDGEVELTLPVRPVKPPLALSDF